MYVLPVFSLCAGSQANLHALIQLKPALSHLGDKGLLLLLRWMFTLLHTTCVIVWFSLKSIYENF